MSNPYLNFLASLGGPTGSHSTLQKLASSSPATASPSASTTASPRPQSSSFSSSRHHSTAAPRAPSHLAGNSSSSSSSLSYSSKSSRPSHSSTASSHRPRVTPSSYDRDGHTKSSHHSSSSSRSHDRSDSINYRHGQDRPYSNNHRSTKTGGSSAGRTSRDFHDDGRNSNNVRSDRKHERDVDREVSNHAGSTGRIAAKDLSLSESGPKKRRARSRSKSQSRSSSPRRDRNRDVESSRGRSHSRNRNRSRSRSRSRSKSKSRNSRSRSAGGGVSRTRAKSPVIVDVKVDEQRPSTPPPRTPPPHEFYHDMDDMSSLSTLSSPASSFMSMSTSTSPILRSAQLPQSPSKHGLSPLKKRHLEDILQAEASYSSPSSLSSLSPDRSNRTSYDRELGVSSVDPSTPAEAETARHDFSSSDSPTDRLSKEPATQQSLELELFGAVLSNSNRDGNGGDTNGTGSTKNGERSLPKSSKVRSSLDSERKIRADQQRSLKKTNGHSGPAQLPKGVREIVTINTLKGTVTSSIVKTPLPVKPSQGSGTQAIVPVVQANTNKDAAQKPVGANANGNGAASTRRMSILHSDQIVAAAMGRYKNHFHMIVEDSDSTVASSPSSTGADTMHVSLEYPGKDSKEKFTLMKPFLSRSKTESDDKDEYNPIEDLVQTVRIIMEHFFAPQQYKALFGSATEGLYRSLTKYKNRKDGAQFMKAVEDFNVIMRKQKAQGTIQDYVMHYGHRLPYDLVVHLLQQVYSRTVAARASKLNQYEAFSNNVYGEILPILTKEFIQRTKLDQSKVFVDLGCGIGNVVLQVALQTGAESYGVEIMDTPAKFAKKQAKEFEARSRAYGLSHGSVTMLHGDFLDTPGLPAILAKADVVLVNNYAFNSALNQSLLQLFLDLKEGCKIISLKTFVSLDHKINVRNAGSVESILRVKKYPYYTNAVSWTHNGGEYYIATVDRTAVQAFWERAMAAGGAAALDDGSSRRASSRRR